MGPSIPFTQSVSTNFVFCHLVSEFVMETLIGVEHAVKDLQNGNRINKEILVQYDPRKTFEAPVKKEYIIKAEPSVIKRIDDGPQKEDPEDSQNPPPSKRSKKNRGQNKHRAIFTVKKETKPCTLLFTTKTCDYDGCKNLHTEKELETYLQSKEPDIYDVCPVYEKLGYCSTGLSCRFGSSHIRDVVNICKHGCVVSINGLTRRGNFQNEEEQREVKTESAQVWGHQCTEKVSSQIMNVSDRNILQDLRKQKLSFVKAKEYLDKLSQGKASVDLANERYSVIESDSDVKLRVEEIKRIDFADKLYLAPLTTVGNLPYRRVCKNLGADVTCGEMAVADDILKGGFSEHALLRRHKSEDLFGIQLCSANIDQITKAADFIGNSENGYHVDFLDINLGCPIDLIYQRGAGSALIPNPRRVIDMVNGIMYASGLPCTVKMRTGVKQEANIAHKLITRLKNETKVNLMTLHGRSREQRYSKLADWGYINTCAEAAQPVPLFGNGDCFSYSDYQHVRSNYPAISGVMLARGALIKPWVFTEIKQSRHWDISASERLDILKDFVHFGLEYWGSDDIGVAKTRHFLLEWLSFLCRYIPTGLLEVLPQRLNERPPNYFGRSDLETLMASQDCKDWVKISEMLLGPVPDGFFFVPKHKANSFSSPVT